MPQGAGTLIEVTIPVGSGWNVSVRYHVTAFYIFMFDVKLRPTVALTSPLPAYADTQPTVALCCIGCPHRHTAYGCPVFPSDVLSL